MFLLPRMETKAAVKVVLRGKSFILMPSNTTSRVLFHYVYVLKSLRDGNSYIGYTTDLKRRVEAHRRGRVFSTKVRRPFMLVYYEACLDSEDAKRREHYLKSTQGRRFLGLRLLAYQRRRKSKAFGIAGS